MNYYAGIGSRETPEDVLQLICETAERLMCAGWTLRSGHAPGADRAFEDGASRKAEVYLPWPSFENSEPLLADVIHDSPTMAAMEMAAQYHPNWYALKQGARKLHARNCHQVLGPHLDDPVRFVLCWTPNGEATGGTGQALRVAEAHDIPIFNLARDADLARVENWTFGVAA